ncbi:MAG: serine/threonine-protein kinase [Nannocystaceae bacterium]
MIGPGQRFGEWEILRKRGKGGMGEVFEALYGPAHRRFALKVLGCDAHDDPEARTRFDYEYWALDRIHHELHHESIVAPFCAGETEGLRWYAMELLEGESLDHVANRGVLAPLRVCRIGVQIAGACAAMHGIGLIHRDLKPGNIFLLEGEGDRVKLLDTGIVKLLPEFFADAEMRPRVEERLQTLAGVPIGTPGFMAPEVILGAKATTPAQDIYGLAATLYRLAVGRFPYARLLAPAPGDEPRWSEEFGPPLPRALEVVLRKALTVDPLCRQSSMSELREQLDRVLEELEAEAAEAEEEERGRGAGEPAREDPAPTVIEAAVSSEAGAQRGPQPAASESRREAIAIEPGARPSDVDHRLSPIASDAADLPAPLAGDPEPRDPATDGPPGGDGRAAADPIDAAAGRMPPAPEPAPAGRSWRAIIGVALVCVALGFALGRVPGEADAGVTRWARGVAAAARHLPPREVESAVPPAPPPVREDTSTEVVAPQVAAPEVALPPEDEATPKAPRRLGRVAFRKVVRAQGPALEPCIASLPEGTEATVEVRVRSDGSVERVRVVPEVSFIAQQCVDRALGGLRFPQADVASAHTWPLRRP